MEKEPSPLPQLPTLNLHEYTEILSVVGTFGSELAMRSLCLLLKVGEAKAADLALILPAGYSAITSLATRLKGKGVIETVGRSTHEMAYRVTDRHLKTLAYLLAPVLGTMEVEADLARYREKEAKGELSIQSTYRGGRAPKKKPA